MFNRISLAKGRAGPYKRNTFVYEDREIMNGDQGRSAGWMLEQRPEVGTGVVPLSAGQTTSWNCLRGHFHMNKIDRDNCYYQYFMMAGTSVETFMVDYHCNRLVAEQYFIRYG